MYSKVESDVLSIFFTNLDRDVYAATDAMPNSLWAFLEGGYSRSELSMRDRFLQVFSDLASEETPYESILEGIASGRGESEHFNSILDRAEVFMRKWAVEYGHNSLKDSSHDRLAIENVSIRATKILETPSLGAFQEKSTRYMDFSEDRFYIPESEFVGEKETEILTRAMNLYREVLASATSYFKVRIPRSDFKTENAWLRTCKAKAFDEARYLLPTCTKTSLGVTMPTRETERWISELLASPEKEIRDLAVQIKDECVKINPGLLTHVEANEFLVPRNHPAVAKLNRTPSEGRQNLVDNGAFNMSSAFSDNDTLMFQMGMNFAGACGIFDFTQVDADEFELAMNDYMLARGKHDELPKWTAQGSFTFKFTIDIGAYRDVQRHRVGTQYCSDWCPLYGYSIPDFLLAPEASELKAKYVALQSDIKDVIGELYLKDRFVAGYFLLLGTNIDVVYTCDFRQLAYFIELRSGASGHYSYRRLAQEMYRQVSPVIEFSKFIHVDMAEYSDRRIAEERIQEKIKKAEGA